MNSIDSTNENIFTIEYSDVIDISPIKDVGLFYLDPILDIRILYSCNSNLITKDALHYISCQNKSSYIALRIDTIGYMWEVSIIQAKYNYLNQLIDFHILQALDGIPVFNFNNMENIKQQFPNIVNCNPRITVFTNAIRIDLFYHPTEMDLEWICCGQLYYGFDFKELHALIYKFKESDDEELELLERLRKSNIE